AAAQRFVAAMVRGFAPDFTAAWQPIGAVELEWVKLESNPRLLSASAAPETLVTVGFVLEFGEVSGRLDWILPESLLEPMRESLTASGPVASKPEVSWTPQLRATLQLAEIELRAILGHARISIGELVSLSPGDVIPIDSPDIVTLHAGEVPLYRGRFGV